ncbi:MAG: hypothetical protein Q8Q10_01770, partial [bacterium]|nr:hypothetical protein [bacterium]
MFNILRRDIVADLLDGRITVEDFYRDMYFMAVAVTVAIFAGSLLADVSGFNGLNIVLIPVWVIIAGYFGFHPTYVLGALTVGATASLGRDASRQRIIDGMGVALEKWKLFFLHGAMVGGVFFLTRFLVPIRNYPFAGMVLLGALITLGLWAWLYGVGKWYKLYVLILVLVSLAVGVFGTFAGKPTKGGHPLAPMSSGVKGIADDFFYSKTLEVEVGSLAPHQLCGVRPGKRDFTIPRKQYIFMDGDNYEVTSYVRVNGSLPNESFAVDDKGCVQVSFAFTKRALGRTINPQMIQIA